MFYKGKYSCIYYSYTHIIWFQILVPISCQSWEEKRRSEWKKEKNEPNKNIMYPPNMFFLYLLSNISGIYNKSSLLQQKNNIKFCAIYSYVRLYVCIYVLFAHFPLAYEYVCNKIKTFHKNIFFAKSKSKYLVKALKYNIVSYRIVGFITLFIQ